MFVKSAVNVSLQKLRTILEVQTLQLKVTLSSLFFAAAQHPCHHDVIFDFEDPNQLNCFKTIPDAHGNVSLSINPLTVKHLKNSLKWNTSGPSTLPTEASEIH